MDINGVLCTKKTGLARNANPELQGLSRNLAAIQVENALFIWAWCRGSKSLRRAMENGDKGVRHGWRVILLHYYLIHRTEGNSTWINERMGGL